MINKKIIFLLSLYLLSTGARAENVVYAGLLQEDLNHGGVAEMGVRANVSENIQSSFSVMWFAKEENVYNGVNSSIGFSLGDGLKLYTGLGAFVGRHETCSSSRPRNERECESDYTGGLYPEVALQISIAKFRLSAYSRYYRTFESGNNEYQMYGIYLGYEM